MRERFIRWCLRGGAPPPTAQSCWEKLSGHYGESHRAYHDLRHISASLIELDRTGMGTFELEGAIWFHDVIYDPARSDNEDASAALFDSLSSVWLAVAPGARIHRLILATDFRRPRSADPLERLMVDIDLAILSSDPDGYDVYRSSIRREYAHIPSDAFTAGRLKVLEHFLARPIYLTAAFSDREEAARRNLRREIGELKCRLEKTGD